MMYWEPENKHIAADKYSECLKTDLSVFQATQNIMVFEHLLYNQKAKYVSWSFYFVYKDNAWNPDVWNPNLSELLTFVSLVFQTYVLKNNCLKTKLFVWISDNV